MSISDLDERALSSSVSLDAAYMTCRISSSKELQSDDPFRTDDIPFTSAASQPRRDRQEFDQRVIAFAGGDVKGGQPI